MATIVRSKSDNNRYILLGTGYGAYQSANRTLHPFFEVSSTKEQGMYPILFVCNEHGAIGWLDPNDFIVESIDGIPPGQILNPE